MHGGVLLRLQHARTDVVGEHERREEFPCDMIGQSSRFRDEPLLGVHVGSRWSSYGLQQKTAYLARKEKGAGLASKLGSKGGGRVENEGDRGRVERAFFFSLHAFLFLLAIGSGDIVFRFVFFFLFSFFFFPCLDSLQGPLPSPPLRTFFEGTLIREIGCPGADGVVVGGGGEEERERGMPGHIIDD